MISRRLPGSFESNALSREIAAFRAQGRPFLDLTSSNPTRCGLPYPEAGILAALAAPSVLAYDPDPRGAARAREAVAAWHGVDPGDLVLTASTSEAYGWLFKLLCDPGDQVLVPSPSYPLFHWLAALEGVEARQVPALRTDRWDLDFQALAGAATPRTRAVVVVNPNNPTGQFLSREEWPRLLAFCAERGLALLVDEVFADYALEPAPDHLPTALGEADPPCPLFVLSGLSKIAALPQIKLGWIVARGAPARACLEPLAFIADQYLSVSAPALAAAGPLLALAPGIQAGLRARLASNLAALDAELARRPSLSRARVEGGWSAILRVPALEPGEDLALRLLREAGVLIHPGHFFDLPGDGHLVCSLLPADFPEGIGRVGKSIAPAGGK
ncbi:pyridoxal phosphate-dependent aminotransferase [Mesoterricola silvestris]|uniref:Aminotransferase n=1 Tax=Mesoterricola silvestris TaxID=2927979 RepID=A0AA48K9S8_9BACT|nr:pyridoxal phosphate-dependent aminotransferase [Mesoterricola silvestris]BDU72637.1 aminotransferase [Mesoterricola silvestris]